MTGMTESYYINEPMPKTPSLPNAFEAEQEELKLVHLLADELSVKYSSSPFNDPDLIADFYNRKACIKLGLDMNNKLLSALLSHKKEIPKVQEVSAQLEKVYKFCNK